MKSPRSLLQAAAMVTLAAGALLSTGCTSLSVSRSNLDTIVALAPAPVIVKQGHELRAAEAAAARVAGAQAFVGAGDSMEPIYASGTAIVVTPCAYADLRAGMSVVYVNSDGRGVAHALVQETRDGWIAQGANNPAPDTDRVTARNLVGVVTQAFASSDTTVRREIANRAVLQAAPAAGQVALNLSKASTGSMVLAWQ